jgi:type IV pilus assembly protein PilM
MPPPKGFWGIDIGQCALKALRVEMLEGKPTATAFDYVEHPKILSQPDADPDVLIREALEKFLSRNQIRHDEVAIGIAGQSGLARFVKLPPVEEKKIAEIVKFEAKQQIPFPLDEVVWDYQKIAGGDVTDGFAMETEIGLFAMKRDVIGRYLGYFGGAKIEVHCVQMSPLALVNYTTYEVLKKGGTNPPPPDAEPQQEDAPRGKKQCVVVLDIGTEASNLIITDGGKIIWQRPIPLGGNNFTRALTKELKLTFAKAEHLKRNAAKSPELPQILKALKPVLQDFVGEVQRSLGYFTNTHRDAHVSYMVGLGSAFRLPGLQKYLAEKLTLDVRKPTAFARLAGDVILKDPLFVENMLTFPVAYGLALQAIGEARLTTNLLPTEIRTDRLIRAKKPYAAASAAALLLGTAGLALGYGANLASVTNPEIKKAIDGTKSALTASDSQKTAVTTKKGEIDAFQKNVKQIIAGADERLDWPRFEEVFSAALPRPGTTGNLPEPLWRSGDGFKAVGWFQERMREGVKIEDNLSV